MSQILIGLVSFLFARLREPSTHAGLAALLVALSQIFPQYAAILQIVATVFGGGAAIAPDPASSSSPANRSIY